MKYFTFAIVFLLISCETLTTEYVDTEKPFFDLEGFFKSEIQLHQGDEVTKKVAINEQSETQIIEQFDVEKALSIFIDCDINKPQLFDKYEMTEKDNQIVYTSNDESLKVQKIEIFKNAEKEVEQIVINRKADTAIYTSNKILTYTKNRGFSIENDQNVLFSDAKKYTILIEF